MLGADKRVMQMPCFLLGKDEDASAAIGKTLKHEIRLRVQSCGVWS